MFFFWQNKTQCTTITLHQIQLMIKHLLSYLQAHIYSMSEKRINVKSGHDWSSKTQCWYLEALQSSSSEGNSFRGFSKNAAIMKEFSDFHLHFKQSKAYRVRQRICMLVLVSKHKLLITLSEDMSHSWLWNWLQVVTW